MEKYIQRECKHHGLTKFNLEKSGKRFNYACISCRSQRLRRYKKEAKRQAIEYKGGKCEICSYNKCQEALEFHHTNPLIKDFEISDLIRDVRHFNDLVKSEVDKCILVCSNCHKEIHANLKGE